MLKPLFFNGRFLTQGSVTGVQRVAIELLTALDQKITDQGFPAPWKQMVILAPHNAIISIDLTNIEIRRVGFMAGHLWEQIELPWYARSGALVGLGNTGPLVKQAQMVMIHDAAVYNAPKAYTWLFRAWYRLVYRILGFRIPLLLTVSQFSKKELAASLSYPQHQIKVLLNGVDHVTQLKQNNSVLDRITVPRPFVLAVGSANPNKNMDLLYDIAFELEAYGISLVIAGGSNRRVFAHADSNVARVASNIQHLGRVGDDELKALYSYADIFVFPSLYEGFGLPPLEAMACGCPVVASNRASIPEVCKDAALYFDPTKQTQLLEQIKRVLDDAELRSRIIKQGQKVALTYTWEHTAGNLFSMLTEFGALLNGDSSKDQGAD